MTLTNTQLLLSEAMPRLSREAEKALFQQLATAKLWGAKQQAKKITAMIVKANLPLVVRAAKRFVCPGISEPVLVSEGLMKLFECIDAFKVELGFKFSTYFQGSLYRHLHRFVGKEQKRAAGRAGLETVYKMQVAEDPLDNVGELYEVLEDNIANLTKDEMDVVLHTYGIGKLSPKTLKALHELTGKSIAQLKVHLITALEKLGNVMVEENSDAIR